MKNPALIVLYLCVALILLIVPVCVTAQQISGTNITSDLVAQPLPSGIRIRSDVPLPDPTITPVMVPMPGMGPMSGYNNMPMGMMGGTAGTYATGDWDDQYTGYTAGMGMVCPMMAMMGGMNMPGGAMGYGIPDYYNSTGGLPGNGNSYSYNTSYPGMGGSMMAYGGYPARAYGYNSTYTAPGMGMPGYAGYASGGGCGGGGAGMPGYGMMGYGYNLSGYGGMQSGSMMGQNILGGLPGNRDYLPYYGIVFEILVILLLISWTIVGIVITIYLVRKMPESPRS